MSDSEERKKREEIRRGKRKITSPERSISPQSKGQSYSKSKKHRSRSPFRLPGSRSPLRLPDSRELINEEMPTPTRVKDDHEARYFIKKYQRFLINKINATHYTADEKANYRNAVNYVIRSLYLVKDDYSFILQGLKTVEYYIDNRTWISRADWNAQTLGEDSYHALIHHLTGKFGTKRIKKKRTPKKTKKRVSGFRR